MKILVPCKRVPDPDLKVKLNEDGTGIVTDGIKYAPNYFDEIACEEALRIREKGDVEEIVVVSIGPDDAQTQIRHCMALGADRGVHVVTDEVVDSDLAAQMLAKVVETEKPDLILMGKQATDTDCAQGGPILAEMLGYPQALYAASVTVEGTSVTVKREVDGGIETVKMELPCIITTDLRLNEPRFAKLPSIMKAKKKPIDKKSPADLGVEMTPKVKVLGFTAPPERQAGQIVPDVATLVDKLVNEAKVF